MKLSPLNKLPYLSSISNWKLSSKLMVSFVTLAVLMGMPNAYGMTEGDGGPEEAGGSSMTSRQMLDVLPSEMVFEILSYVDKKDLTTLRLVSKDWKKQAEEVIHAAARGRVLNVSGKQNITNEQLLFLKGFPFEGLIAKICKLNLEAVCVIAEFMNLRSMNLFMNDIPAAGAAVLAHGNLSLLTSLNLSNNYIADEGVTALAHGNFPLLSSLFLMKNNIGDNGAKALANGNLTHLTALDLSWNYIGDEGAHTLANGNLTCLTLLDLKNNDIGDKGVEALANGNLAFLTSLNLSKNKILDKGVEALAKGNLILLTSLNLSDNSLRKNRIGDEGVEALANGNLTCLTALDLGWNHIGDAGTRALANGNLKNLRSLNLENSHINDEGAKALLISENWVHLISLDLSHSNITRNTKELLKDQLKKYKDLAL